MPHTAEIIAVGTELLSGSIANTNAQFLSEALSALGISVHYHTVVGDNPERMAAVLRAARARADIILTTGGLGPTYDDVTRDIVSKVFDLPLEFHPKIEEEIRAFYLRALHISMPENNLAQAMLPQGCTVFPNAVGTAPGCAFEKDGVHVLMLPGPPHELRTMLERYALPYLCGLSDMVTRFHDIMTFGIGEASVDELLRGRMALMANPSLATYARPAEVRLRATASAPSAEEAEALLTPVVEEVRAILGDYVYGIDVKNLEEQCFRLLKEKNLTFATAESCTGGQIAARITALSGASAVYRGGVVSYWSEVKRDALGVPWEIIEAHGAVSEQCARAMAEGARALTGAELGVSVTGVAGPDSDERGNPVGRVFIALAADEGTFCRHIETGKRRRERIQLTAANHAFDLIRRYLTGLPMA